MKTEIVNVKHNQEISFIWNQIGMEIGSVKYMRKKFSDKKHSKVKLKLDWSVI